MTANLSAVMDPFFSRDSNRYLMNHRVVTISLLLATLAAALWSAGCIGSSPMEESLPGESGGGTWDRVSRYPAHTPPAATPSGSRGIPETSPSGGDVKVVRTAWISLEVPDAMETRDALASLAGGCGGYVASLSMERGYGGRISATLVMRVPEAAFEDVVRRVGEVGKVLSQSVKAEDVTEDYYDLRARREAFADQLAQYRKIMERAGTISEVLEIQREIERVQVEIDRIDGRLKYLSNRVEYATITVSFSEPEPVGTGSGPSLTSVINESIAGFLAVSAALVIILVSVIPLIILGSAVYLAIRWAKMRRTRGDEQKKG